MNCCAIAKRCNSDLGAAANDEPSFLNVKTGFAHIIDLSKTDFPINIQALPTLRLPSHACLGAQAW